MTPRRIVQAMCIAAAVFPAVVHANDSSALLEAGGIVLTTSADVTMESEDLTIGRTRVRVSYVFRNTGTKEVRTRVGFRDRVQALDARSFERSEWRDLLDDLAGGA